MKPALTRSLLPLIVLLFLSGCARAPIPVEGPLPVYSGDWLPGLRERSEHWTCYQARVNLRAETPEKRLNLNAIILARLPGDLRLEAFRLGQTVGLLTMEHGQSSLFLPSEDVVYTAERSEHLIAHFLGIPLPLELFGYSLSASLPPDQLDDLQLASHGPELIGYAKPSGRGWSYAWQFLPLPQKIKSARIKQAALKYEIVYEPPVGLAVQEVPQKITFASPEWQIVLTVQEMTAVPTLPDAAFTSPVAGEIRHVDLSSRQP